MSGTDALYHHRATRHRFIIPSLAIETSRGCWWGDVSHCTFCGLNGSNMAYRSKTPERVIEEFNHLSQRYNTKNFLVNCVILASNPNRSQNFGERWIKMNDFQESYYPFSRFELYNLARKFRRNVYKLIKKLPPEEKYGLDPQMRTAIVSVTNNITEGHGRWYYQENRCNFAP